MRGSLSQQTHNTASKHEAINNHQPPDNNHSGTTKPQASHPPSLHHRLLVDRFSGFLSG